MPPVTTGGEIFGMQNNNELRQNEKPGPIHPFIAS